MATGDANDFASRIRSYLPGQWFPSPGLPGATEPAPYLNAVLSGFGAMFAALWTQLSYAKLQTRIKTASDSFLDLIALDFFGSSITRAQSQSDAAFLAVILTNLFRQRVTRYGHTKVCVDLTGRAPVIFEPARPSDAFCLGSSYSGLGTGRLGSYSMPGEVLITAYRPLGQGYPNVAGLGSTYAGLGKPYLAMPDPSSALNFIPDAQIYAAINSVRAAGTKDWVNIKS